MDKNIISKVWSNCISVSLNRNIQYKAKTQQAYTCFGFTRLVFLELAILKNSVFI